MRVLGVDPGLTRCGLGVVDGGGGRSVDFVAVDVVRTSADLPLERRLLADRRRRRGVDRGAPAGRGRRRAGVQPAQRAHRDGHRAGQRGGGAARRPGRAAGGLPHPQRGEGRRHRRGAGREGAGHGHGHPAARAGECARDRRTPRTRWRWPCATAGGRRCWTGWRRRGPGPRSWRARHRARLAAAARLAGGGPARAARPARRTVDPPRRRPSSPAPGRDGEVT